MILSIRIAAICDFQKKKRSYRDAMPHLKGIQRSMKTKDRIDRSKNVEATNRFEKQISWRNGKGRISTDVHKALDFVGSK